jgi:hypothetical protein
VIIEQTLHYRRTFVQREIADFNNENRVGQTIGAEFDSVVFEILDNPKKLAVRKQRLV